MPLPTPSKGSAGETGGKPLPGKQGKAEPEPGLGGAPLLKAHLFEPQAEKPLATTVFVVFITPFLIRLE